MTNATYRKQRDIKNALKDVYFQAKRTMPTMPVLAREVEKVLDQRKGLPQYVKYGLGAYAEALQDMFIREHLTVVYVVEDGVIEPGEEDYKRFIARVGWAKFTEKRYPTQTVYKADHSKVYVA